MCKEDYILKSKNGHKYKDSTPSNYEIIKCLKQDWH